MACTSRSAVIERLILRYGEQLIAEEQEALASA
jgi:hypothetical protein